MGFQLLELKGEADNFADRHPLERQGREGWGAKVIEGLAQNLRNAFPAMKGFSRANLLA